MWFELSAEGIGFLRAQNETSFEVSCRFLKSLFFVKSKFTNVKRTGAAVGPCRLTNMRPACLKFHLVHS